VTVRARRAPGEVRVSLTMPSGRFDTFRVRALPGGRGLSLVLGAAPVHSTSTRTVTQTFPQTTTQTFPQTTTKTFPQTTSQTFTVSTTTHKTTTTTTVNGTTVG
jgi:hypothetical protein